MGNPVGEAFPDIDFLIAEQTINLLDRVLGHQTSCLRQCNRSHPPFDGDHGAERGTSA
jgi:hypothetical protein